MKTIYLTPDTQPLEPSVATIGFFDGLHRGHQFLIGQVVELARQSNMGATVITFARHPRQVLQADYVPQLLTTLDQKLSLLRSETDVEQAVVLPFDTAMAQLSAREFMEQVLARQLGVRQLLIGYDNRFGHNRAEGFDDYVRHGAACGIRVVQSRAWSEGEETVSSSVVRRHLLAGDVERARQCLGRPYMLEGQVVGGHQEGRRLGFPTANLDTAASGQLVPATGAYAARVSLPDGSAPRPAMMNIGVRPTYGGTQQTIEVHIFNYKGDLYGQQLQVQFIGRIRPERHFASPEELARQLREDHEAAEQILQKESQEQ